MSRGLSLMYLNGQLVAVVATLLAMLVSFLGGPYPFQQALQHIPTAFALIAMAWIAHRRFLSNASFACVLAFWWLHILGARWIYSYVPYDDWTEWATGHRLSDVFGWTRNHYDRLVHLLFGALAMPPLVEIFRRRTATPDWVVLVLAFCMVMTGGSIYEIVEWQAAVWMSADQAEAYNGQQGDVWDAQKDMAMNGLGALVAGMLLASNFRRSPQSG